MNKIISAVSCYKNDDEIIEYGSQLAKQSISDHIVFLVTLNEVNNYERLKNELTKINIKFHLYNPHTNLGYLNGCLYGIKQFDSIDENDIIIISNTDLEISCNTLFERLLQEMQDKRVWWLGPSIQLESGRYQNPFLKERPSTRRVFLWKMIQGNRFSLKFYSFMSQIKQKLKKDSIKEESKDVYALHGSFFVLSNKCVMKLISEKNEIFMYGEELLIAEIARSSNGVVRYISDMNIIHNENSTTGLTNVKVKAKWYRQSFNYLYNKFFKRYV